VIIFTFLGLMFSIIFVLIKEPVSNIIRSLKS
jgi:uncharacterized protein involved in exopolysaccharide biosynthesis